MSLNSVTIRRLNKIFLKSSRKRAGGRAAAALNSNLISLGYTLNEKAFRKAASASIEDLDDLYKTLQKMVGDPGYRIMYPNFPNQVANASDVELFVNAITHYVGVVFGLNILPEYVKEVRPDLSEDIELNVLDITNHRELSSLFDLIAGQARPFSEQDKKDLLELSEYSKFVETSVRENAAALAGMFPHIDWKENFSDVTDVLRLATVYSNGDVSLATNAKFKLSRPQRRDILSLLDKVLDKDYKIQDLTLHGEKWKKLARTLHYHENGNEKVIKALESLQSKELKSFNSVVEKSIKDFAQSKAIEELSKKPGIFARRIQELLHKFPNGQEETLNGFEKVSKDVSTAVLIQMWNLFTGPNASELPNRLILSNKGSNPKFIKNKMSFNPSRIVEIIEKALKSKSSINNVYTDNIELLDDIVVPLSLRSAQPSLKSLERGSRIRIKSDKNTIRLFQHWKNISKDGWYGRVDLDLSAMFVDENFENLEQIAYYNLRNTNSGLYHSGDITDAPNGASEFIDIDIEKALAQGHRYVLAVVYNYTRQKLSEVPEAYTGVMMRSEPGSGEIYEPSTVVEKFSLTSNSPNSSSFVFDLREREIIVLNTSINPRNSYNYNVTNNSDILTELIKDTVKGKRMTVSKLIDLLGVNTIAEDSENSPSGSETDLRIDPYNPSSILELLK